MVPAGRGQLGCRGLSSWILRCERKSQQIYQVDLQLYKQLGEELNPKSSIIGRKKFVCNCTIFIYMSYFLYMQTSFIQNSLLVCAPSVRQVEKIEYVISLSSMRLVF